MNLDESNRTIGLPDPSLVLLLGARGSGKSTFARRFFDSSEIVSLDECRRKVGDDQGPTPSNDAQELFQTIIQNRLYAGKLVVVDVDSAHAETRRSLVTLARRHHLFSIAIALRMDERVCIERNAIRTDCVVSPYEVKRGVEAVRKAIEVCGREGIRDLHVLDSPEAADLAIVTRHKLWTDKREDSGPFDIIGDVHGCADELEALLAMLGYRVTWDASERYGVRIEAPVGRRVIFLGDLIDRGPRIVDSLRIAMTMVDQGTALCVPGNHESKFLRKLRGKTVSITHGLAETVAEFEHQPKSFHDDVANFIEKLVGHYVLDGGRLCVVHAGIKANMQGRSSSAAREFGLYGDTTGETDEYGLPVRHEWANEYHGRAMVVYGHTPMLTAEWLNNTLCIDTGCVFGGALTALRYPEREVVSVPAAKRYFEPKKPLVARVSQAGAMEGRPPDVGLSMDALRAGGVLKTRFRYDAPMPAEPHTLAVVEMLSLYGVDPRWLVYIPPMISPVDPSALPGVLEHPAEAFAYYKKMGVSQLVCQEKLPGQRVVVTICRDAYAAQSVFGVTDGRVGMVHTRTGRPVFSDRNNETVWIERCRAAAEKAGIFDKYGPFVIFEAHLCRHRKQSPLPVDAAAFRRADEVIAQASARGVDMGPLAERLAQRYERLLKHAESVAHGPKGALHPDELILVPLSVVATDETSWFDRPRVSHQQLLLSLVEADLELIRPVGSFEFDLADDASKNGALDLWEERTQLGAEGFVIKPLAFQRTSTPGLALPALLCRTPVALRRMHGPDYDVEGNLERFRARSWSSFRYRAIGQHALGMESVARFVEREPLSRIHLCVSAALALECQHAEPTS